MLRNLYFSARRSIIVALTVQLKFWSLLLLSCWWILLTSNTSPAVQHIYLDAYLLPLLSLSWVLMYKDCYCITKLCNLELLLCSVTLRLPYGENKEASQNRGCTSTRGKIWHTNWKYLNFIGLEIVLFVGWSLTLSKGNRDTKF